jgi:hypothetical protein
LAKFSLFRMIATLLLVCWSSAPALAQRLPVQIKQDPRPSAYTRPILSPVYLANAKLPDAEVEALSRALEGFGDTAAEREFFKQHGPGGLVPVSAAELQEFGHYGREAARGLGRRRVAP